jgi:hypothetical protein
MAKRLTPLQLLKRGLERGDWKDVADAHEALTGEAVVAPSGGGGERGVLEEIARLAAQALGPAVRLTEPKPRKKRGATPTAAPQGRKGVAKSGVADAANRFVDDLTEATEDIEIDRKMVVAPPTPRREPYVPLKIECGACHKQYDVHPDEIPPKFDKDDEGQDWVCNRCVTKGRRSNG